MCPTDVQLYFHQVNSGPSYEDSEPSTCDGITRTDGSNHCEQLIYFFREEPPALPNGCQKHARGCKKQRDPRTQGSSVWKWGLMRQREMQRSSEAQRDELDGSREQTEPPPWRHDGNLQRSAPWQSMPALLWDEKVCSKFQGLVFLSRETNLFHFIILIAKNLLCTVTMAIILIIISIQSYADVPFLYLLIFILYVCFCSVF